LISDVYKKDGKMYIDQVQKEKNVDLSKFIKIYNNNKFKKISVENDKTLKGYVFL